MSRGLYMFRPVCSFRAKGCGGNDSTMAARLVGPCCLSCSSPCPRATPSCLSYTPSWWDGQELSLCPGLCFYDLLVLK